MTVDEIAKAYGIADQEGLKAAIDRAREEYDKAADELDPDFGRREDDPTTGVPDALDRVSTIAGNLEALLAEFAVAALGDYGPHLWRLADALEAGGFTSSPPAPGEDPFPESGFDALTDFTVILDRNIRPRIQQIRDAAKAAHVRRSRGNLPATIDLRRAVRALIDYWTDELGLEFTATSKDRKKNPAPWFIRDVINVIDPARAKELPTVLRNLHRELFPDPPRRSPTTREKTGPEAELENLRRGQGNFKH